MEYTNLGRTGLRVSRLCLGTMNFGPQTTEPDSFAIMDRALELGINFFDTANVYGWKLGEGVTEQIIGRWFAQGGGRRDKVVLATKVYGRMGEWPNEQGLSARHIIQACDDSLRRLQTDWIDLYQMHHVDRDDAVGGDLAGDGDRWSAQGKVRYVGSSNFAGWHLAAAQESGRSPPLPRPRLRAVHLQPDDPARRARGDPGRRSTTASASSRGRRCTAGCSAARSASSTSGDGGRAPTRAGRPTGSPSTGRRSRRTRSCARDLGDDPADVALAWLLSRPGVTAPIIGPRTIEQLDGSLRALDITLYDETLARAGRAVPAGRQRWPGPEAWAW